MQSTTSIHRTQARGDWHQRQLCVVHDDDALLALPAVCALSGLGKSLIYDKMKRGEFPRPIKLGKRVTRWRAGEVRRWLREAGRSEGTAA